MPGLENNMQKILNEIFAMVFVLALISVFLFVAFGGPFGIGFILYDKHKKNLMIQYFLTECTKDGHKDYECYAMFNGPRK